MTGQTDQFKNIQVHDFQSSNPHMPIPAAASIMRRNRQNPAQGCDYI
jgi:hypothetical protein